MQNIKTQLISSSTAEQQFVVEEYALLVLVSTGLSAKITVNLVGEHAQVQLFGLCNGVGTEQYDIAYTIFHKAPHTVSEIVQAIVLDDTAKAKIHARIHIDPQTPNSKASERIDTLLLSKDASVEVVPNLEVEESQVVCSHGATITKISPESLFYLTSRGMSETDAIAEMKRGRLISVIDRIPDEEIKKQVIAQLFP